MLAIRGVGILHTASAHHAGSVANFHAREGRATARPERAASIGHTMCHLRFGAGVLAHSWRRTVGFDGEFWAGLVYIILKIWSATPLARYLLCSLVHALCALSRLE